MKILFLHPNFPGQFLSPAALAARRGHEVKFLCQTHYGRILPGVERITLKGRLSHNADILTGKNGISKTLAIAQQYLEGFKLIRQDGWKPDVIVSHSGFACGLHTSYVWPDARKISYLEWWFANHSKLECYDPTNKWWGGPTDSLANRSRNLCLSLELTEADKIIAPTDWQRNQLPISLRKRTLLLPDGVDIRRFQPDNTKKEITPLITYGTRGMEAIRGFPEFIMSLPKLMKRHKDLKVEIAGRDDICYAGKKPEEGSYKEWAKKILEPWVEQDRIKFVGLLKPNEYVSWLQRSWVHVYLTRPFVASWSLLEAMATGCSIIASDTEPIREFLSKNDCYYIDHRKENELIDAIEKLLTSPTVRKTLSENARGQSLKWQLSTSKSKWLELLTQNAETI